MIESQKVEGKRWSNTHTPDSKNRQESAATFWQENACIPSAGQYNLSICDAPKFIWFRNAKVGTRSTFFAFEQANLNLTAESLFNCFYFPQQYAGHFKFAFVRNPWDRFVSGWLNKVVRKNAFELDSAELEYLNVFDNFVSHCAEQDLESWNNHFRFQHKLIDLNEVDFIGRHEFFERDLRTVFERLQLNVPEIPTRNKTDNRQHYSRYYSDKSIEMISDMYRKDIQVFGYQFEDMRT